MPPRVDSRYQYSRAFFDSEERTYLEIPEPIYFVAREDNIKHIVASGDSLHFLAYRYFRGIDRPARYWWVIAQFNDITDATLPLETDRALVIPSTRYLRSIALAPPPGWAELVDQLRGTL